MKKLKPDTLEVIPPEKMRMLIKEHRLNSGLVNAGVNRAYFNKYSDLDLMTILAWMAIIQLEDVQEQLLQSIYNKPFVFPAEAL